MQSNAAGIQISCFSCAETLRFGYVNPYAAEQKARVTYDNLLRLVDDRDVCDVLKFLREREIVHYQRFGEAIRTKLSRRYKYT